MRDKAVSIDLNTNVEVGEENIIVPGDQATFQRKNTENKTERTTCPLC